MTRPLAEGVVPQLLREIYVGRRNGWLHLVRGGEQQSLRFRRGHIVNARTNVVQERLGEVMVRRGLLSEADLARATEIVIRDKRRLGEVLGELGLVDASGLEDAVALHVHDLLAKVFSWTDGTYSFEMEEDTGGGELTLKVSMGELILEAVQAVRDPDVVRYALGDLDRVPAPSSDPLLRFQKLTLSPADGFVLSRVDGSTSAREIVQLIPLPAEEVEKSLFGLLSTGVIEYTGAVRSARGTAAASAASEAAATPVPPPETPAAPPPAAAPTVATAPPPSAPAPPVSDAPPAAPSPSAAAPPVSSPAVAPADPAPPPAAAADPIAPVPSPDPASSSSEPAGESDEATALRQEILEVHASLKTRNHFEVLGLARNVTEAEVKEAYFGLAKRFHPDVHHGSSLGDLHDQLEAVFIRLGEAYDVLRDPRRRADYEERLGRARTSRPATPPGGITAPAVGAATAEAGRDAEEDTRVAEEAIRRAQKLFEKVEQQEGAGGARAEGYWDAIQLLEPSVARASGRLRSKGEILLARCYLKNPNWARKAEELMLSTTRRDPAAADAWAILGGIYKGKGMQNRALSMYRKAFELRPDHEEAGAYLAAHQGANEPVAPPPEGGGLLRRLFRKP